MTEAGKTAFKIAGKELLLYRRHDGQSLHLQIYSNGHPQTLQLVCDGFWSTGLPLSDSDRAELLRDIDIEMQRQKVRYVFEEIRRNDVVLTLERDHRGV